MAALRTPSKWRTSARNHVAETGRDGTCHTPHVRRHVNKYRQNGKRIVRSRPRAAVVCVLVMFGAHAADAQSVSAPQPASHQLPSYCRHSTLTGLQFLQLIHTIIAHGDLADVAFLEKTLGTKFSMSSLPWRDGVPNVYQSNQVLGNPIEVSLSIDTVEEHNGHKVFSISFSDSHIANQDETFIPMCLHISVDDTISFFGEGYYGPPPPPVGDLPVQGLPFVPPPPQPSAFLKDFNNPKEHNSRFELAVDYDRVSLMADRIGLRQTQ